MFKSNMNKSKVRVPQRKPKPPITHGRPTSGRGQQCLAQCLCCAEVTDTSAHCVYQNVHTVALQEILPVWWLGISASVGGRSRCSHSVGCSPSHDIHIVTCQVPGPQTGLYRQIRTRQTEEPFSSCDFCCYAWLFMRVYVYVFVRACMFTSTHACVYTCVQNPGDNFCCQVPFP